MKKTSINFRVEEGIKETLVNIANEEDRSVSNVITRFIKKCLGLSDKKETSKK